MVFTHNGIYTQFAVVRDIMVQSEQQCGDLRCMVHTCQTHAEWAKVRLELWFNLARYKCEDLFNMVTDQL